MNSISESLIQNGTGKISAIGAELNMLKPNLN